MYAKIENLPERPPATGIEFLSVTYTVQEHPLTDKIIFTVPEFHPEKMHLMPATSESDCKLPYTFFYATFYVRVDNIVDISDLHRADLFKIIFIEEHHTLEYSKEKYL
jgi:hypothetical protein